MSKVFRWGFVIVAVVIAAAALWPGGVAQAIGDPDASAAYHQAGAWQMGIDRDRMHRDDSRTVYTDTVPYGHNSFGMMDMMCGGFGSGICPMAGGIASPSLYGVEPLSLGEAANAVETAQRYLDRYLPGADADEEADAFYGYYTIHILRDGETVGMLSVNGTTRQVFLHTWHGDLIEMSGESHG